MLDSYLAKKKMKVKELSIQSVFFTTVWRGDIVMGFFDLVTKEITQFTCFKDLELSEMEQLENVIMDYLSGIKRKNKIK